jgi:hypothetical protein
MELLCSVVRLLYNANVVPTSLIIATLMMEAIPPPKPQFSQEPHDVAPHKTELFIVTAFNL